MRKKYSVVRGKFEFRCNTCNFTGVISVKKSQRTGSVTCVGCGEIQYVELNRRTNMTLRTKAKNQEAHIAVGGLFYAVELENHSYGGVGLIVAEQLIAKIQLRVEDWVVASFSFCNGRYEGEFIIRSIKKNRVGLEYKDKQLLSPHQRIIEFGNRRAKE